MKSNVTGLGYDNGRRRTVGCSRKGKIWSMSSGSIATWKSWCDEVGAKLSNPNAQPNDFLKYTLIPSAINELPKTHALMVDWPDQLFEYSNVRFQVHTADASYEFHDCQLDIVEWGERRSFTFVLSAGENVKTCLGLEIEPHSDNTERGKVRIGCVTSVDRALKSRRPVNGGRTSHSSRPTRHLCGWPTDRSFPTRTLSQSDEFVGGAANKSTGAPAAMIVFAYQHETALQVAARDQFLDEQPGHDRLTRTGIVGAPRARLSDPRAQTPTPCARSRFL
jgi:hypothetical protein